MKLDGDPEGSGERANHSQAVTEMLRLASSTSHEPQGGNQTIRLVISPEGEGDASKETTTSDIVRFVFKLLRASWHFMIGIALLGAVLGYFYGKSLPRVYTAASVGFVATKQSATVSEGSTGDLFSRSRIMSYVTVATSREVANRVRDTLGLKTSPGALVKRITVSNPPETILLNIKATGPTPVEAQQLANAWLSALEEKVLEIETLGSPDKSNPVIRLHSVGAAEAPLTPTAPSITRITLLGGLFGILVGLALGWIRLVSNNRVSTKSQVEEELGIPVIGSIPMVPHVDNITLLRSAAFEDERLYHLLLESLRKLRTNIRLSDIDNEPRIVTVTSPHTNDGKTTVAVNLAIVYASRGLPTIILDGDLRKPRVAPRLGLSSPVGLMEILTGDIDIQDVVQDVPHFPNLYCLGTGHVPPNPTEVLESESFSNLLKALAEEFVVIIDSPPLIPVIDAAVLTRYSDGAVLVASAGRTTLTDLKATSTILDRTHGKTLGVVINKLGLSSQAHLYYGPRHEPKVLRLLRKILKPRKHGRHNAFAAPPEPKE